MGIFDRFPSTKLNDINLDWVLKKLRAFRGGTTDQVLAKASNADFDFKWITGGGGTSDYDNLINQPQINSVTLTGNQSASDLGLLDAEALNDYRTAAAQDLLDAAKQAKITASGILKGDGDGGVAAAVAGTDYLAPAALNDYRTAAAQDVIDAAQDADIASRAKADEIGIVITGARPSMVVSAGQYVIVRGSTITGITDGLYKAINALSPSTDVTAADLTAVSGGGLNSIVQHSEWNLLWTNPNTGVDFASQNIPVDLSAYTEIRIVVEQALDLGIYLKFDGIVGGRINAEAVGIFANNGIMRLNRRSFTVSASGVNVSDGAYKEYTGTTKVTSNSELIPYQFLAK